MNEQQTAELQAKIAAMRKVSECKGSCRPLEWYVLDVNLWIECLENLLHSQAPTETDILKAEIATLAGSQSTASEKILALQHLAELLRPIDNANGAQRTLQWPAVIVMSLSERALNANDCLISMW